MYVHSKHVMYVCINMYTLNIISETPILVIPEASHIPLQMNTHPTYYRKGGIFNYSSQLVQDYSLDVTFRGLYSLYLMCILDIILKIILRLGHDFSVIHLPYISCRMNWDFVL